MNRETPSRREFLGGAVAADGDDVRLAKAVPGIDVVIGGHSHTELTEAILVNGRTPVVQTGKQSENLGGLVITIDGDALKVESYRLHPIDDTVAGERAIMDHLRGLPVKNKGELPTIPVDERAAEVRAIKAI
jgi:2',3'-cyclic-nucleotide 2'-phosphodiesterase (5'-nucleotidase family)